MNYVELVGKEIKLYRNDSDMFMFAGTGQVKAIVPEENGSAAMVILGNRLVRFNHQEYFHVIGSYGDLTVLHVPTSLLKVWANAYEADLKYDTRNRS